MDCGGMFCGWLHPERQGGAVMDIWYKFALVCALIAAIGLWAGLSKDKRP